MLLKSVSYNNKFLEQRLEHAKCPKQAAIHCKYHKSKVDSVGGTEFDENWNGQCFNWLKIKAITKFQIPYSVDFDETSNTKATVYQNLFLVY